MFSKIITIVLVFHFATSKGYEKATKVIEPENSDAIWNGLVATWPISGDGFYGLPLTLEAAKSDGWTEIIGAAESPDTMALGYYGDRRLTLLFWISTGDFRGAQIGVPAVDLKGLPIDYDNHVAIVPKVLNDESYYTATFYLSKDEDGVNQILLQYNATRYDKVPIDADRVTSETPFLAKNCVPTMANPHYYVMNSTTDCLSLYPWFLLRKDQYIVGIGFFGFGNATSASKRQWFEPLTSTLALHVTSDPAPCLGEFVDLYGLISLHIWFRNDPASITCSSA